MTVEATTNRVSYTGSGTTGPFSVPFYFLEADDLVVIKTNNSTGVEETLTMTTDYTVSGAADPDGGSVTLVSAISSAYSLVIVRDPDRLQSTAYPRNDPFPAASHERALDKLTMLVQRMRDLFDRSFRLSDGNVSSVDLEISDTAAQRANKYLGFDSDGNLTLSQSLDVGSVVISAFMETVLDDTDATAALTTLGVSAFVQTLLDDADAATALATLGARGLANDVPLAAGKVITFEGATDNDYETTLTAADPSADRTITLPDKTGTVALTSDIPVAKIKQVVFANKTDTFSTASTTFTDITGLSVSITPTSAGNKVLVMAMVNAGHSTGNFVHLKLLRDSTDVLVGDAASSRLRVTAATHPAGNGQSMPATIVAVDAPGDTSAHTYKIQAAAGGGTAYINRTGTDTDGATWPRAASSIIAMEYEP
jgi:hypothetical protein